MVSSGPFTLVFTDRTFTLAAGTIVHRRFLAVANRAAHGMMHGELVIRHFAPNALDSFDDRAVNARSFATRFHDGL